MESGTDPPNTRHTFLCKEVDTADGLLDLQALLHLARLDVPEPDSLIVRPTNQPLTAQQQRRAVISVTVEEPDALRKRVLEVRLAVVERAVERFPEVADSSFSEIDGEC